MGESLLSPDKFLDYAEAIGAGGTKIDENTPENGRGAVYDIWMKFTDLVKGKKGPFSKKPHVADSDNLAKKCAELWAIWPPSRGDLRRCAEGGASTDYQAVISILFAHSIPLPVSSRRYGRALYPILAISSSNRF